MGAECQLQTRASPSLEGSHGTETRTLLVVFHKEHNTLNFSFHFFFIANLISNKMCEIVQLVMISEHFLKVKKCHLFFFFHVVTHKGWVTAMCE